MKADVDLRVGILHVLLLRFL